MKKNIIQHCGKRIPTERVFTANNWPFYGDVTTIYQAVCGQTCSKFGQRGHNAYAFYTTSLSGTQCEITQADKHTRQRFDALMIQGLLIEHQQGESEKRPTRGQPFVGDYTKKICRPVEQQIKPWLLNAYLKSKKPINPGPMPDAI